MTERCPKCGNLSTPEYLGKYDLLIFTCKMCGYAWEKEPLDKVPCCNTHLDWFKRCSECGEPQ